MRIVNLALLSVSSSLLWTGQAFVPAFSPLHKVVSFSTGRYSSVPQKDEGVSSEEKALDKISQDFLTVSAPEKDLFSPIPYSELTIGVLKETWKRENRVSQSPESVSSLVKAGFNVVVQEGGKLNIYRYIGL